MAIGITTILTMGVYLFQNSVFLLWWTKVCCKACKGVQHYWCSCAAPTIYTQQQTEISMWLGHVVGKYSYLYEPRRVQVCSRFPKGITSVNHPWNRLCYCVLMIAQDTILGDQEAMQTNLWQTSNHILVQCPNTICFLGNFDGDEWIMLGWESKEGNTCMAC